ncbi:sodium-dependent transporter [Anaerotignum sp. MB30-C6]|uniref:sodium-dependent transporter n=1 Tax=Anaerotignum sp. MB30-C6 TaxID=3070814 RepID=UPI0027DC5D30|nr:sodium-dependent transporter [Anaerotignum sp. MB30-C6]WMI81196.1 sodium-dependent transporter [Anaerotignum sp. MB30-C6]
MNQQREKFSSRLGFILISAGCAIGLGNVWKFPYITGQFGGAAFVLIYILFLILLGLPILVAELSVGRASQKSVAMSMDVLQPKGTKWHYFKYFAMAGNYILMMFYTTVAGWMIYYFFKMASGGFVGLDKDAISSIFGSMLSNPVLMTGYMIIVVLVSFGICSRGLQKGVEKITKVMMVLLLLLMVVLATRSIFLEGGEEGLRFYLTPNFSALKEFGVLEVLFAALGQAFFTLSIGMGAIAIFGSYIDRSRSLTGEAVYITILDTMVALMAGLIIFPACFAYGINPDAGPSLIFITLPNVFNAMPGGRLWGSLFFLFMCFAAFSTVIAVFENIISFGTDLTNASRKKVIAFNLVAIILLSIPCVLGFNVLSGVQLLGEGSTILDFEDFIVSNNILPLGSVVYVLFCTWKMGWGWDNFMAEANSGVGLKFPKAIRFYVQWILPVIVLFVFVMGYKSLFFS